MIDFFRRTLLQPKAIAESFFERKLTIEYWSCQAGTPIQRCSHMGLLPVAVIIQCYGRAYIVGILLQVKNCALRKPFKVHTTFALEHLSSVMLILFCDSFIFQNQLVHHEVGVLTLNPILHRWLLLSLVKSANQCLVQFLDAFPLNVTQIRGWVCSWMFLILMVKHVKDSRIRF